MNHDFPPRGSSNGPMSATSLEDRFEVLKDIGDGSFGSVALARVRTAGAHIARRGTLVNQRSPMNARTQLILCVGCHQNDEKDIRRLPAMSRASRSHLPTITTEARSSCPGFGYLSRSHDKEATYLYGIYGWKSIPVDESA